MFTDGIFLTTEIVGDRLTVTFTVQNSCMSIVNGNDINLVTLVCKGVILVSGKHLTDSVWEVTADEGFFHDIILSRLGDYNR